MAAPPAFPSLKAAVGALYGTSERERSEANTFLMAYAASSEAWSGAHQLLLEPDEQAQYFGANLLFIKVRSEWHALPDDAKSSLYASVRQAIAQRSTSAPSSPGGPGAWPKLTAAVKRLCLALAAMAVRSSAVDVYVREALGMASSASGGAIAACAAVELLIALPQET